MENLTSLLKKNPQLRNGYVTVATKVTSTIAKGLNSVMKHLLVVQDIDPNTQPGNKEYLQFSQQLRELFNGKLESSEFTGPYDDEVWLRKHLAKAQGKFSHLDKDAYKKLTDLSHVPDRKEEDPVAPLQVALSNGTVKEVMESKAPVYTVADQDKFAKMAASIIPPQTESNTDHWASLKEALQVLSKYASNLEAEVPQEKVQFSRQMAAVGPTRRFPGTVKVVTGFKNGVFRRVHEEKK